MAGETRTVVLAGATGNLGIAEAVVAKRSATRVLPQGRRLTWLGGGVHVLSGCFLDRRVLFGFLGAIDPSSREAHLWGDGDALAAWVAASRA